MDRNKIVRVFRDKNNKINCLICDGLINFNPIKLCPPLSKRESYACLCTSSNDDIRIRYSPTIGNLFNNTTDKIISTIYDCGSNTDKCNVTNCNRCNLKICIDICKGKQI